MPCHPIHQDCYPFPCRALGRLAINDNHIKQIWADETTGCETISIGKLAVCPGGWTGDEGDVPSEPSDILRRHDITPRVCLGG